MREFPYKTWLCAAISLLMPWVADAAGLGRLTVLSSLGQPLSAEIELMSVQKDELATLTARMASPDAFQQANIQYSPALAGARLSIERRPDGRSFIKITSARTVTEPYIDLLVELSWAQGRLVREYTALVDPPGYTPTATAPVVVTPVAPRVVVAPTPQPAEPATAPPVALAPQPSTPRPSTSQAARAPAAKPAGGEYAVKRGDTLFKIASSNKPEGVTVEQMLVGIYRNNTDAFDGNMNRLKSGRILRLPGKADIADTTQTDAVKEIRVQSTNWNQYRMKLADTAGAAPAQETSKPRSGKIVTGVEDKAAGREPPKEVLKLSKGDATAAKKGGTGKPMSAQERVRALEEEATAREKSLAEANQRVTQLEKNIKDMQRLIEMKGVAPAGKPVVPEVPPLKGDQTVKPDATKAAPLKAEPPKTDKAGVPPVKEPVKAPVEAPKVEPPKVEPPKVEPPKVEPPKAEPPKGDASKGEPTKGDAPKAEQPVPPKPKPKISAPPPPPPEPELVDQIISAASDPVYLGGALGGLALLGGGAYFLARRRRKQDDDDGPAGAKTAPTIRKTPTAVAATAAAAAVPEALATAPAPVVDDVDPLAEADLYLNFGRDAQAEEVLKEALEKNPRHEEAQLKLLQIYAGRKDPTEFEKIARKLNTQTAGMGDSWLKAAAMGYAFDPDNPLYAAGKSAPTHAAAATGAAAPSTDLDFDLELSPGSNVTQTDVPLDIGATETTQMMQPGVLAGMAEPSPDTVATQDITADSALRAARAKTITAVPDFSPVSPDIKFETEADRTMKLETAQALQTGALDFNFDANATTVLDTPAARAPEAPKHDSTLIMTPENQAAKLDMDFDLGEPLAQAPAKPADSTTVMPLEADFKLDLGAETPAAPLAPEFKFDDINLTLDDKPSAAAAAPAAGGAKDDHWYDVQTKFDLAKAYQEMGDKDGAREILQEVIKEGDPAQQGEAKQLLDTLG